MIDFDHVVHVQRGVFRHHAAATQHVQWRVGHIKGAYGAVGQGEGCAAVLVAQLWTACCAITAVSTHADKRGDDAVAHGQAFDAVAHRHNATRTFVAQNHRWGQGNHAFRGGQVAVANAAGFHLDHDFSVARGFDPNVFNGDGAGVVSGNDGAGFLSHGMASE